MRARLGWTLGIGGALALACSGPTPDPVEAPPPSPTPPAPPAAAPPPAAAEVDWPLVHMATVPDGRTAPLPAGHRLLDVDVDPTGRLAAVVTGDGATTALWTWDFDGALLPVAVSGVEEVAFSPFGGELFVVTHTGTSWTVGRGVVGAGTLSALAPVYSGDTRISSLVAPLTRYDEADRLFFARAHAGARTQVLGVRRTGERAYEVTSPGGELGERTAPELRSPPEEWQVPPIPLRADDAAPTSLHPVTGALYWRDGAGGMHERAWDSEAGNWGDDRALSSPAGEVWAWHPNGWYSVAWSPTGVALVRPDGTREPVPGAPFLAPPAVSANGRTLVGATLAGLTTRALPSPLAPVRWLSVGGPDAASTDALAKDGLAVRDSEHDQLYRVYDANLYEWPTAPVFASLDGMLEVLHAGFRAIFVGVERDVARPRLKAFLAALGQAASRADERRIVEIARTATAFVDGDFSSPEGVKVLAESRATSELHGMEVDFSDFHPRGPYATGPELESYFRAFKYVDQLRLTDGERAALLADPAVVAAWRAWIEVQAPYLSGTRYEGMFGDWKKSPWAEAECLPNSVRERPPRAFPLSWGLDSEILERVVAHDELPAACTVPTRVLPSGLDLLTALGSPEAAALQRAEYAQWPALAGAHTALRARFSGELASDTFVNGWLRLVQILGNDTYAPEGVAPSVWRRRLMETALASWTSFRHTTVLVNERSAAQMGGGGPDVFETLSIEPVRGAVDPVPAAWSQLATLLDRLAVPSAGETGRLAEVLARSAADARRLGDLSAAQMKGTPLTEEDYTFIAGFAGTIEHPYLLASAVAAGKPDDLAEPDPMMRIVDVASWNDPEGPPQYWHVAVGRPRAVRVLLGDRGLLTPAVGAVYSYYEVVGLSVLDDAKWRDAVDATERPAWVNPSLP